MEMTEQMLKYNHLSFSMSAAEVIIDRGLGSNYLYNFLKKKGIIEYLSNRPIQQYIDDGYFELKQPRARSSEARVNPYGVTHVKPRGIIWIRDLIDKDLENAAKSDMGF